MENKKRGWTANVQPSVILWRLNMRRSLNATKGMKTLNNQHPTSNIQCFLAENRRFPGSIQGYSSLFKILFLFSGKRRRKGPKGARWYPATDWSN
jgi:hypothetical protein